MEEGNINSSQISQEQPKLEFKPLEIGGLFKRTWEVYKSRFWVFVGIMLLPMVANFLALILMIFSSVGSFLVWKHGGFLLLFLLLAIIWLLLVIFNIWGTVALLFAIKDREEKIGVIESFRRAKSFILSYCWISILTALCIVGGLILLIIPGIIFWVWFQFATYVLVVEKIKGRKALLESKELVKGYWWKVFLRDILVAIISLIVAVTIGFIPYIGRLLVEILVMPFWTVFFFLIYEDLKRIKSESVFSINQPAFK